MTSGMQHFFRSLAIKLWGTRGTFPFPFQLAGPNAAFQQRAAKDPLFYSGKMRLCTTTAIGEALETTSRGIAGTVLPYLMYHGSADRIVPQFMVIS